MEEFNNNSRRNIEIGKQPFGINVLFYKYCYVRQRGASFGTCLTGCVERAKVSIMTKLQIKYEDQNSTLFQQITQWLFLRQICSHPSNLRLLAKEYVISFFHYQKRHFTHFFEKVSLERCTHAHCTMAWRKFTRDKKTVLCYMDTFYMISINTYTARECHNMNCKFS